MLRSDLLLGPALWVRLWQPWTGAVFAYNLLFFLSFVLTGWTTYWVLSRKFSWVGAAAAGYWYTFVPYRLATMNHIQILLAQWIPILLWSFDRLIRQPTVRRGLIFLTWYVLHLAGGAYLGMMVHLAFLVIILYRWNLIASRFRRSVRTSVILSAVGALAISFLLAANWPYLRAGSEIVLERTTNDYKVFGATLMGYVTPSPRYKLHELWPDWWPRSSENMLFPGFIGLFLATLGTSSLFRRPEQSWWNNLLPHRRFFAVLSTLGIVGGILAGDLYSLMDATLLGGTPSTPYWRPFVWLSIGVILAILTTRGSAGYPVIWRERPDPLVESWLWVGLIAFLCSLPVVYVSTLARWVPGFQSMRVVARFGVFVLLAMAILVAAGVDLLAKRIANRRLLLLFLLGAISLEHSPRGVNWHYCGARLADLPEVYRVLATQQDVRAVVELPFYEGPEQEAIRMYYGSQHGKPLVNGYSASLSPGFEALKEKCKGVLPDAVECIDQLRSMGVNYIVTKPEQMHRYVRRDLRQFGARPDVDVVIKGRQWLFRLKDSRTNSAIRSSGRY